MNNFQSFYPQNYPQFQNVYQPPMNQQNQVQSSVVWVGSRAEAESYLVGANNSVTMWDSNGEYVYRKSADASGRPEFHAYKLMEEGQNVPDYATKDDLESAKKELRELISEMKSGTSGTNQNGNRGAGR